LIVSERLRTIAINSNAASGTIASDSLRIELRRLRDWMPSLFQETQSKKGGFVMGKQIQWETSLTTAKTKAKKEKKLILMDFYNNH
jgi:hypothetical protein